jgi:hypothetical protein
METLIKGSGTSAFKKVVLTLLFLNMLVLAKAQLNSTSSQTISTSQTYTGTSTVSNNSTVTVSGGTTTFNGNLTVGNSTSGSLVVKNGATVIINGRLTIGTGISASVVIENGGKLIVNPGSSGGTAAVAVNSTAATALDVQTGGSVIVNAGTTASTFGLYETSSSNVSIAGSMQIRGGGLKMDGSSKLSYTGSGNDTIIGPSNAGAYFTNNTTLTVGSNVNLYIRGDVKHDSNSSFVINGNVSVNGNYQSGNNTANVTGTGTLNTTGSLDADSYQGSVFGQRYSCSSGPCSGANIITSPNASTCNGGVVQINGNVISGATYQWLVSTTSFTSGFSNISGATAQNYSTTGSSSVQYTYYKRQYTLSGQTYNSNTLTITSAYWSNAPTVAAISGTSTICAGGTTTLTDATSGGTWSSAATSVATISSSGVVTGVAAGTSIISYTVTSGGCSAAKNFTMTVSGATAITTQPVASTICAGSNTSFTVAATGAGLTYIWKENGSNLSNGGIYSGATSATLTLTGATAAQDNKSYSVFVQGTCGSVLSNSAVLTVNSVPSVTAKTVTTCSGTAFTVTPTGVPAGTTYTWSAPSGTSFTGGSAQASGQTSISQTLTNTSTSAATAIYTVTPTSSCGAGSVFTVTVTVNPATAIAVQPAASTVCTGAANSFSVSATGLGLTYIWKEAGFNLSDGGIYSGTSTATLTLTGVTSAQNNKSYSVFVQGTCGSVLSSSGLLTVTPAPTAVSGTNFSTCSNSGAVNITTGASATNYSSITWTINGTGTITSPNSLTAATYTPSAADISAGSRILTLTAVGNGTCANVTSTKTITITAAPTAVAGTAIATCSSAGAVNITAGSGSTNNNGTNWTSSGTGTFANPASLTTATYTPSAADIAAGSVTLTLTAAANGTCTNATSTKTLTINGQPSITLGTYPSICAGQTSASVTYSSPVNSPNQYSINWSDAANAAGISDVAYSTLSGGTIPLTGLTATAGVYGAVITVRNSTTGCETICATSSLCGTTTEGGYVMMTAPGNGTFAKVTFASYGTPTGSCPTLSTSTCNAANSVTIVEAACLGKNTFSVDATNAVFGNPCGTTAKTLKISVLYSGFVLTVKSNPAITSTVSSARCGTGSITIRAAASTGSVLWYTQSANGSSIYTGENYTIPSLSATTTYYVEASSNGCSSTSRTAVVATVNTCAVSWIGVTSTAWTTASNWSYGFVPAASDTAIIPTGVPYYPVITTAVSVYKLRINSGASVGIASTGILNMYGDLISEGTLSAVEGSSVSFKGATAQKIAGVPVLYNVVVNNNAGVALQSALTVNGTLSLAKGVLTTNSNLTINFDNGGNIGYSSSDLGSISGSVTGRRDAVAAKTHYIGAPFSGVTSAQVAATTPIYVSPYWKMYSRSFSSQSWTAVTNSTTAMPLGTGFSLSLPAAAPLVFTGTYDHTFTLTGPGYPNTTAGKYLLVANPYPSTIDWDNASGWTKTNVGNAAYYWDAANNRVASYVAGIGTNGATRYIPAMQAILVGLTGSGGSSSVSVNNNARVSNQNPAYLRTASDVVIRILIQDSSSTKNDETVIRFNENATNEFDQQLDAHKILNNGLIPSVYTTSGSELYSINSYANPDSAKFIPLAAKLPADGKYTITITNDDQRYEYVLVDKKSGIERTIKEPYTFTGLKTDDVNRFELQLRVSETSTGTGTPVTTGIQPASKTGGLTINSSIGAGFYIQTQRYAGIESTIEILDITGNSITTISGKNLTAGNTFVPLDLTDGSYLVKVHVGNEIFAGMIVVVK